jgi:hypothetical protein
MNPKQQALQEHVDLLSEKIRRFRRALAIETEPAVKLQLEQQLVDAETEREEVERQLTQATRQTPDSGDSRIGLDVATEGKGKPELDIHLKKIQGLSKSKD